MIPRGRCRSCAGMRSGSRSTEDTARTTRQRQMIALTFERMPRVLLWGSAFHLVLAVVCSLALFIEAPAVMGVHPALKPLKFAISISLFLATMGVVIPCLSVGSVTRAVLAWTLVATMLAEMIPIALQAARGTTSHFNETGVLDTAAWRLMFWAIILATVAIASVAVLASVSPLRVTVTQAMDAPIAFALRVGLWLMLLVPVSGFAMGGRQAHTIGGVDGQAGLPFLNWSVTHGDLRVAHFFAMHAVQVLPTAAWLLMRLTPLTWIRWSGVGIASVASIVVCVGTLVQAFAGKPLLRVQSGRTNGVHEQAQK